MKSNTVSRLLNVLVLTCCLHPQANSQTPLNRIDWAQPAFGVFGTGASWEVGVAPGSNDLAVFGSQLTTVNTDIGMLFLLDEAAAANWFASGMYNMQFGNPGLTYDAGRVVVGSGTYEFFESYGYGIPDYLPSSATLRMGIEQFGYPGNVNSNSLDIGGPLFELEPNPTEGQLTLEGNGNLWTNRSGVNIGTDGNRGSLTVREGAKFRNLDVPTGFSISFNVGGGPYRPPLEPGYGELFVSDEGSELEIDTLFNLVRGKASFARHAVGKVHNSGRVQQGTLLVESGASLNLDGELQTTDATSQIIVRDGGTLSATSITGVGSIVIDKGDVRLSDKIGLFEPTSVIEIRPESHITSNYLEHRHGVLTIDNASLDLVGAGESKANVIVDGSVVIRGEESNWNSAVQISIGRRDGVATLDILDGAKVTSSKDLSGSSSSSIIGRGDPNGVASNLGTVNISGEGSKWTQDGYLNLGFHSGGHGILNVGTGAEVESSDGRIGRVTGSTGEAHIEGTWKASGSIYVGGNETSSGGFGSLELDGGIVHVGESLTIHETGELLGIGTVIGDLVNEGTISPGFSPGRITVEGDFVQDSGTLQLEVIGGVSGVNYDRLMVDGDATVRGALMLVFEDYDPTPGDFFDLVSATGVLDFQPTDIEFVGLSPNAFSIRDGILTVTIPEPSTFLAAGTLCICFSLLGRRSRNLLA